MAISPEIADYLIEEKEFPNKTVLNKEGANTHHVYVIIKGKAKIKKRGAKGLITVDTLGEGEFIGEMGLLKQGKRSPIVSTVADGPIVVGLLDTERLASEWNDQPEKLKKLISNLMRKLDQMINKAVVNVEMSK